MTCAIAFTWTNELWNTTIFIWQFLHSYVWQHNLKKKKKGIEMSSMLIKQTNKKNQPLSEFSIVGTILRSTLRKIISKESCGVFQCQQIFLCTLKICVTIKSWSPNISCKISRFDFVWFGGVFLRKTFPSSGIGILAVVYYFMSATEWTWISSYLADGLVKIYGSSNFI